MWHSENMSEQTVTEFTFFVDAEQFGLGGYESAALAADESDLHEAGVLHRDLKPSNVLYDIVRGTERVLVADLGLAKAIAHASGFTVVAGTPGYMAPEQSRPGGGQER